MPRQRPASELLALLGKSSARRALDASTASRSIAAFYKVVGMRNPSRSYFVRHAGRLHSLKAVVTHALRQEHTSSSARDFHAADAAKRLRDLKFDVVHNANNQDDKREREWLSRLSRRGQATFREKLIDIYGRCALTGCTTLAALEAAHVRQVSGGGADSPRNGILLRADIHKMFDANLIAINPRDGSVHVAPSCRVDYAKALANGVFFPPPGGPCLADFKQRWPERERSAQSE